MTTLIGRPGIPGQNFTFRLNQDCLDIVEQGASLLARVNKNAPSRAAWLRDLIDQTFQQTPLSETMDEVLLAEKWNDSWISIPTPHKVTVRLEERHRILLRQFECYVQSLDWMRELYRNETTQIFIASHGPVFNRLLLLKINRQDDVEK
ncbi:hypothetical protein HMPREF1487_09458 [Pseudomonas sp. HPB0071]|uniref:Uncharacterized protein n=1 Tax=Pseudomonas luteola TaxID=47886 RepID=A0A2X2BY84_PSELU|nr:MULTISPECIES: hypothetical protein [Pseudomonas]ENA26979.1 hypothetical protein HMPREF1487_09458 [Pseudomonas sp. HPB0071]MBA1250193.1 hypothetical protein [Pseudomonas zeshuii]MBH3440944.1 hypothetical protein [Pseudomonas luteola]SPY99953.1 Uncharacterised protein [Pseudomonas luteola]